jgi:hypothetical protein
MRSLPCAGGVKLTGPHLESCQSPRVKKLLCESPGPLPWYDLHRNSSITVAVIESFLPAGTTQPTEDSWPRSERLDL